MVQFADRTLGAVEHAGDDAGTDGRVGSPGSCTAQVSIRSCRASYPSTIATARRWRCPIQTAVSPTHLALIDTYTQNPDGSVTLYYTLSTWNPYQVFLMSSTVRRAAPPR